MSGNLHITTMSPDGVLTVLSWSDGEGTDLVDQAQYDLRSVTGIRAEETGDKLHPVRLLVHLTGTVAVTLGHPGPTFYDDLNDVMDLLAAVVGMSGQGQLFEPDRPVEMDELQAIWAEQAKRGIRYNGCTSVALRERYGDRVYHVMGVGWFVSPVQP